jgi:hypothetical protein
MTADKTSGAATQTQHYRYPDVRGVAALGERQAVSAANGCIFSEGKQHDGDSADSGMRLCGNRALKRASTPGHKK